MARRPTGDVHFLVLVSRAGGCERGRVCMISEGVVTPSAPPPLSFSRCALVEFHPLILSPRSREETLSPPVLCGLSSDTAFLRVRWRPSALLPGGADGEAGSQSGWAL